MESNFAALNLALALFSGFICICRMGLMSHGRAKPVVRWGYVTLFVAIVFSVVYGYPVTLGHLVLTAGVAVWLSLGFGIWRYGLPLHAMRDDR